MLDHQKNQLDVIYSKRTDENVLQEIFDIMSYRWLGKYTPLSPDVIRPVYDHIQRLLRQIDSIQRNRFDAPETLQARLSWYEVLQVYIIFGLTSLVEPGDPTWGIYRGGSSCAESHFVLRSSYARHENLVDEVD